MSTSAVPLQESTPKERMCEMLDRVALDMRTMKQHAVHAESLSGHADRGEPPTCTDDNCRQFLLRDEQRQEGGRRAVLYVRCVATGYHAADAQPQCHCCKDERWCCGPFIMLDAGYMQRHAERNDLAWLRKYRRLHWLANMPVRSLRTLYRHAFGRRAPLLARRHTLVGRLYGSMEDVGSFEKQRSARAVLLAREPDHHRVFVRELDLPQNTHRFVMSEFLKV